LLLLYLVWIATSPKYPAYGVFLVIASVSSRLPLVSILKRALWVLPFAATFALVSLIAGDPIKAVELLLKSVLSAGGVVLLVATTPVATLMRGAELLGAPRLLVAVIQFLYRYLFVLVEQAWRMRMAARCRGGWRWQSAGGAVAVLFGSAYGQAEGIHRAMLARGFDGSLPQFDMQRFGWTDGTIVIGYAALLIGGRLAWGI
jgi:cobalt/nickel transport system permease protein